ncbi:DUF1800 family protein [Rhizobacter sp. Root1221]|uniref:DUF1800 domain-containing protein n=1 Tax=Rhizobacter sp. Root1221 TaxID=1736433 RepID=UPI0006F5CC21|nr:DUF1800 domain-containing protein [Rhizobacter sp. Root1221]KQV99766.1 hypothetical protein ASC87_03505 [Rhizobacter sp. Root1221]
MVDERSSAPESGHWRSRWHAVTAAAVFTAALAGCGGSGGSDTPSAGAPAAGAPSSDEPAATPPPASPPPPPPPPPAPTTQADAVRLADQASFGPTEALITTIKAKGPGTWVAEQMALPASSRYTSGNGPDIHKWTSSADFCTGKGVNCWRDWYSTEPLLWDFYRNALGQPDQLRQRVAFALQQILVVSSVEVSGTYGFRKYHNNLLDLSFGNYREVLRKVTLSPVMGDFLNNANNDRAAPNENFARELLQLFSIGTCELTSDGSLKGGKCTPTYTNDTVRAYAFALTGWTYPAGGATSYGCYPTGANCRYYDGDMVKVDKFHDTEARDLLNGYKLASGHKADAALTTVLDSLMAHPNTAPFVSKQLIQHLVSSNPSKAYVARVAAAFQAGKYQSFGTGVAGDLKATVAAVLLDEEARAATPAATAGKLREPVQMFTGVLRALNGKTDGDALSWQWGDLMRQHMFRPPSVFNYYPPDYPVPGTQLVGPTFGIHNANTALGRLNYLTYLIDWGGTPAANSTAIPATGTAIDLTAFAADAANAGTLVDRLSMLAIGRTLSATSRAEVIKAVEAAGTNATARTKAAAYLVFGSPQYHVQR